MQVIRRRGWEIPERLATPEALVTGRRGLMAGALAFGGTAALGPAVAQQATTPLAAARNPAFDPGRAVTDEKLATTYNNFYEFGESKNIWGRAQALKTEPWTIRIEGMVREPRTLDLAALLKQVTLEERVYRFRCVEAWAMTVPYVGFPLAELVKLVEPLGSAKYVAFQTLADKSMPGTRQPFYPWPYTEGLAIDEAMNELAFLSVGLYGKVAPPQNGAPIRLTVPWKYGFKHGKSIVKITFTDQRPKTFWEALQAREYGFWANVNPAVSHPRWSQARERLLGDDEMVPSQLYNGYGEFVAALYTDRKSEKLFM
jgi:sulfoxide reductase catalytic subunit YedY